MPACSVREPGSLNVCELYRTGPLVLALFVDAGSCAGVLSDMQALAPAFPGGELRGGRRSRANAAAARLMRKRGPERLPVGFRQRRALAALYKVASCPQVSFVLPGGVVQSKALLSTPSLADAARARGASWSAAVARRSGWARRRR